MESEVPKTKRPVGRPRKERPEIPPQPKRVPFSKMDQTSEEYKAYRRQILEKRRQKYLDNSEEFIKKVLARKAKKREESGYEPRGSGRPRTII
jgi:hypothetical protein